MKPNTDNSNLGSNLSNLTPENIALILQNLINQQSNQGSPLQDILTRRLAKQEADEDEEKRIALESRKQNAIAIDKQDQLVKAQQEYCPHIKANRETHVIGQRDHNNNYHWFCQGCLKHWVNGELPSYLAVDPQRVGGPQL